MATRSIKYTDPAIRVDGLTNDELSAVKWIILETYADTMDRAKACKVADITPRELALLESSDSEFKTKLRAIEAGDDVAFVDEARAVVRSIMSDSDNDATRLRAALAVLEKKGNWAPKSSVAITDERQIHPFDQSQFAKPLRRA